MKRITLTLAAILALAIGIPTAQAETSRPHYETPRCVTTAITGETSFDPVWCTVPYADFYNVRVSPNKDLSQSWNVTTETPDTNSITVDGLTPGESYYYVVRVSNSRGQKLSDNSVKLRVVTLAEPLTE